MGGAASAPSKFPLHVTVHSASDLQKITDDDGSKKHEAYVDVLIVNEKGKTLRTHQGSAPFQRHTHWVKCTYKKDHSDDPKWERPFIFSKVPDTLDYKVRFILYDRDALVRHTHLGVYESENISTLVKQLPIKNETFQLKTKKGGDHEGSITISIDVPAKSRKAAAPVRQVTMANQHYLDDL